MPLRILFADDSMTAQNMGKKILTEAGYDVVAVSNGAAAVKKIAEQKPDIIILDVYMPGYSGLEVCEKVRASLETAKTPVLLTVGKMEPHKPEDANRVKADGVIIKPFEASDLLAIIKKFEERVGHASPPPLVEQTVLLERRFVEDALSGASEAPEHHSTGKTGSQPMVEVPDHMATSAAFSDLLGADPSHSVHYSMSTPSSAYETSVPAPAPASRASEYDLPISWRQEDEGDPVAGIPVMVESVVEAPPVAEPRPEPVPRAAEPSFVVPIEAESLLEPEPAAEPAPMSLEVERFGEITVPVEPAAEAAPVMPEPAVVAAPVAVPETPLEPVPVQDAEPIMEAPPVVAAPVAEAAPVVEVASVVEAAPVPIEPAVAEVPAEEAPAVLEPTVNAAPVAKGPQPPHPHYIPVYREPEPSSFVVVPTAAPPTEEIPIPREPALLGSAEEATRNTVADLTEPGLMPTIIRETSVEESVEHFQAAEASVEAGPAEIAPLPAEARPERPPYMSDMPPAARPEPPVEELPAEDLVIPPPAIERIAENADFDFEARVAAAMAAYNQTPAADVSPVDEAPPAVSEEPLPANVAMEAPAEDEVDDHPLASPVAPAEAVTAQSTRPRFEPPPSFEYYPPIRMPEMPRIVDRPIERPVVERPHAERPVVEQPTIERHAPEPIVETVAAPVAEPAPPPVPPEEMTWTAARAGASGAAAPAVLEEPPVAHHDAAVAASLGAALPTAVAAAEQTGADQEAIAQVVSRVMERFAPALVDEIMRELKAKK